MKIKKRKKGLIACAILAILCLFVGVGIYNTDNLTASATTYTTEKCLTRGVTMKGDTKSYGCPENFQVYMYGSSTSGTKTLYQNNILDWSRYYITVETSKVSNHLKFELYWNGYLYIRDELSGNGNLTLYSGTLPDGEYELRYYCRYRSNVFVGYTQFEYSFKFEADNTAPKGTLKTGGIPISNGSYTNQQIEYSATDKNFSHIRVCSPGSSFYSYFYGETYTVAASDANNGWWYFYAQDYLDAASSTASVCLDTIAPVGTVKHSGGTKVANGGYTGNPFSYTATDNLKMWKYQVKKPTDTTWQNYNAGTMLSGTYGWYYFRAIDFAENVSEEYKVYYDPVLPIGSLFGGTTNLSSGSYTNASYIKYVATDSNSGIANCYVKMPNSSSYTNYASGTQLATGGLYYFYCVDRSGNYSPTVNITLDKTKPTGTLYGGTSVVSSGSATNAQYIKFVPYDAIGLNAAYVKKPGLSSYVSYTSGTQLTAEGAYTFYCTDRAGNVSQYYTVTLDRHIPAAQLYVDDKPIDNNSYTNGAHIKFSCPEKCYVKLPGSSAFQEYVSGTEYYKPGKYVFYGLSAAGTSSGNYTVIIDRTIKTLTVNNVKDGITDGDVTLTWTDGNAESYAPISTVTINGKIYNKSSVVHTIATGQYDVHVTDAAGNTWQTSFSSIKRNIVTKTLQQEYFEAFDADGTYYAFASYDSALAFAQKRESGYVTTGEWHSANWDTGMAMDAKDSVNAVNGRYFVYKKSGNPEERVAYFTEERLNEVITEYAKQGLEDYFYWEKEPATIADGENLFAYSDGTNILASSVQLGSDIGCLLDGKDFVESIVEEEGEHILTVKDEWGNSRDYHLTVVRTVPDIEYAVGEGNANTATFERTYYFKDQVALSVAEPYDEMAMLNVYDEDGLLFGNYFYGETCIITESGKYTAEAVNHYGKSETFSFIVSRNAPKVAISENAEKKHLDIGITESTDNESHIDTLEILKSTDGGETWVTVKRDDYGKIVLSEVFSYTFCTSGIYKVVVTDEFRTGIDAVTQTFEYVQPNPKGVLRGVSPNGYTNNVVSFEWTDEAIVTMEKDGVQIDYVSGQKLSEDGAYALTFENRDGYCERWEFVIDTKAPVIALEGVENGGSVSGDVTAVVEEDDLSVELYQNGKAVRLYYSGTTITECGNYRIVAIDRALNQTVATFTIDKEVGYSINVNEKGLSNAVVVNEYEELSAELTKDGENVDFVFGEEIVTPGVYSLVLTDALGNRTETSFTIVQPIVKTFEYNFDDMPLFERVEIEGEERRLNYGTLELKVDGEYEVGVVVGGETYFFTVIVDSTAPEFVINGVEDGGKTNGDVSVSVTEEGATMELFRDGVLLGVYTGSAITGNGSYTVKATDLALNENEVSFTIDKEARYTIDINDKGLSNGITATANEELTAVLKKNDEISEFTFGEKITEPGQYLLTLTDELGNQAEVSFVVVEPLVQSFKHNFDDMPNLEKVSVNGEEIVLLFGNLVLKEDGMYEVEVTAAGTTYAFKVTVDNIAPVLTLNGVENGKTTESAVTLTDLSESAEVRVYLNGEEVQYDIGDELTEKGQYYVTVTDACGNYSEYSFTIEKSMNGGWIALIVIGGLVLVGGAVAVVILKKKNVF